MEIFTEKGLIDRIIELRREFAGERGRSKFAETLGISPSTYSYYEKDRVPPIPILLKICRLCNVSVFWLLTGQNEAPSTSSGQAKDAENRQFSAEFGEFNEKLKKLSAGNPVSLQAVMAFLELMEQKSVMERKVFAQAGDGKGWIAVLGRTAAGPIGMWNQANLADSRLMETRLEELVARHINSPIIRTQSGRLSSDFQAKPVLAAIGGSDLQVSLIQTEQTDSNEICQFVDCPGIAQSYPDCFALQVDGDSMSPRINDGDIVIASPSAPAIQGQAAIISVAGAIGVTCKLLRIEGEKVHLVPINEKYDTKIIKSSELLWGLAVLCHIKLKNIDL